MKRWAFLLTACLAFAGPVDAVPNQIFNNVFGANSPLNGQDLTGPVLGAVAGEAELPGEWREEARVGGAEISHLLARPEMFGQPVVLLRSVRRDGELERVEATFADAGSYFGYNPAVDQAGLVRRQQEFAEMYEERLEGLREMLAELADRGKPKERRFGHVRVLRAEVDEWRKGDLVMRLFAADQRLIRVEIARGEVVPVGWMDAAYVDEGKRERAARLAAAVSRGEDGAVRIEGLEAVPQGYRPYCGLNALAIAGRHFGLHLDEDWMAAAAGFRNTGRADGSNMVKLYHAVAAEAGLSLDRRNRFDEAEVRRALENGMPVVVWRRFSQDRNRLHDRLAARPELPVPDPSDPAESASWPGDDAPLHASVLSGYDPARGEVFFLESWSGKDRPRRMSFEEMAATSYLCFVFRD